MVCAHSKYEVGVVRRKSSKLNQRSKIFSMQEGGGGVCTCILIYWNVFISISLG